MTGRLWGGRRADAFQNALDGHVDLTEHELSEFVQLAHALRDMPPATLGDEARTSMRARLVAEAESVLGSTDAPAAPESRPRRRVGRAVAGSTAAVVALSGGLVAVSADALPGDMLYPIKRGVEQIEMTFSGGGASAGSSRLDQASVRLNEAVALARNGGDSDRISDALDEFTTGTNEGTDQLLRTYASDDDTGAVGSIRSFANNSAAQLRSLAPMLGEASESAYADAVAAVEAADRRAVEACPTCAGGPAVQVPYIVDPIGRLDARPYEDQRKQGTGDSDEPNDVLADPQYLPNGTNIPPFNGHHDDHQEGDNNGNGDGGIGDTSRPQLQGDRGQNDGSSSIDEPEIDPDTGLDDGTINLPELPKVPDADEIIGGDIDLGPLKDILGPVQELLGPKGTIQNLLAPVLGDDSKSGRDKDDSKGPIDGLLGPALGDDRGKNKGEAEPEMLEPEQDGTEKTTPDNTNNPDGDGSNDNDQGQPDQDKGPLDGLVGPVEETDDGPDVGQGEIDGLLGGNNGSTTDEGNAGSN